MRFIEDDDIEEPWAELRVAKGQGLFGSNKKSLGLVDLIGINPVARFIRQMCLETIR